MARTAQFALCVTTAVSAADVPQLRGRQLTSSQVEKCNEGLCYTGYDHKNSGTPEYQWAVTVSSNDWWECAYTCDHVHHANCDGWTFAYKGDGGPYECYLKTGVKPEPEWAPDSNVISGSAADVPQLRGAAVVQNDSNSVDSFGGEPGSQTCSTQGNPCQPSIDGMPPISCCGELECKQIIGGKMCDWPDTCAAPGQTCYDSVDGKPPLTCCGDSVCTQIIGGKQCQYPDTCAAPGETCYDSVDGKPPLTCCDGYECQQIIGGKRCASGPSPAPTPAPAPQLLCESLSETDPAPCPRVQGGSGAYINTDLTCVYNPGCINGAVSLNCFEDTGCQYKSALTAPSLEAAAEEDQCAQGPDSVCGPYAGGSCCPGTSCAGHGSPCLPVCESLSETDPAPCPEVQGGSGAFINTDLTCVYNPGCINGAVSLNCFEDTGCQYKSALTAPSLEAAAEEDCDGRYYTKNYAVGTEHECRCDNYCDNFCDDDPNGCARTCRILNGVFEHTPSVHAGDRTCAWHAYYVSNPVNYEGYDCSWMAGTGEGGHGDNCQDFSSDGAWKCREGNQNQNNCHF